MIVRETIQEGTLKQNKNYPIEIPKHVLDHLISSCRSHADVLNMHYICNKQKLPTRFMNDLIIRKREDRFNVRGANQLLQRGRGIAPQDSKDNR